MTAETTSSLGAAKYVVVRTRKKSGDEVATTVWIAALPDGTLGFTTDLTSGKVRRIRNFPDVTIQPSNSRGAVTAGTSPVAAVAEVLTGPDAERIEAAIRAKYGVIVPIIGFGYAVRRFVTRQEKSPGAAIRLTVSGAGADDATRPPEAPPLA